MPDKPASTGKATTFPCSREGTETTVAATPDSPAVTFTLNRPE
jgi:hypothetical protein